MLVEWLVVVGMMQGVTGNAPGEVTVCTAAGEKKPSLTLVDEKGKCPAESKAVETGEGKERRVMYCVSTYKPKPSECKKVKVPVEGKK